MLGFLPPRYVDSWHLLLETCSDFCPGHAGAMLQARQLGDELVVGIHSDEAILENKGPTVMTLEERYSWLSLTCWSISLILLLQEYLPSMPADGSLNPCHMRHMSHLCLGYLTMAVSMWFMGTT